MNPPLAAIVELEPDKRIVGIKNVTINEHFFVGHFTEYQHFYNHLRPHRTLDIAHGVPCSGVSYAPGVLIIESMAQVAGVLIYRDLPERDKKLIYFTGIESARFRRPVLPGDQLRIEMVLLNRRNNFGKMNGIARVDGKVVAEAMVLFAVVERPGA